MSDLTEWLADAFECAGIEAVTEIEERLIGDLDNWRPVGILAALDNPAPE